MIIIPAIDLKEGKCVRLVQGKKDNVTVYSDDPVSTAQRWVDKGAELLHVVDLDGAFSGTQHNFNVIAKIKRAIHIPVQVGGGIRESETIRKLGDIGVDRVILGTIAVINPDLFQSACQQFPGKVAAAIDAKNNKATIKGWVEETKLDSLELAQTLQRYGASCVVYTDVLRDGMLTGVNIPATAKMVNVLTIPVIASGGVSSLEDIKALLTVPSLYGVITGKALYSGAFELEDAIALTH
jgi:phosphoribosylformimino-5-aminoimidazole carboxamide ribotide isomerase